MTLQRIRKTGAGVLIIAIAVLLAFSSCSQAKNEIPGSVKSISVRIEDGTGARTITPEGNVDITHYEITVHNDAENLHQKSGYLTKGSMFSVSNVPAGTWYAVVDAYVYRQGNDPEYVKVASATSEPKAVTEGSSTTLTVLLDSSSLLNDLSGSVTVTLKMPSALVSEGTPFRYQYRIIGMTDSGFSRESAILSGNTGADGSASVVIDAETNSLVQGSYRLEITVFDGEDEAGSTVVRKGVDVMRLLPGLPATGTIDLNSYEADQGFGITITDRIGNLLTPSLVGDGNLYELDSETGNSLTVTLSEPLTDNETIEWYVSGILDESVDVSQAESGKYTLSFNPGSYSVTAVVRDTETAMAVGSISPFKVSLVNSSIEAELFTFELNEDGKSYTVTGTVEGFVQSDPARFEIPSTYKGLPVTRIAGDAFSDRTDITGTLVLPESLIVIEGGYYSSGLGMHGAFSGCTGFTGNLIIPESVTSIGSYAFEDCTGFSGDLVIPDSVTFIRNDAFSGCSGFDGTLTIGSKVETIGAYAFQDCIGFTDDLVIPESVTSIGTYAFDSCSSFDGSLVIPDSVTSIEQCVFYGCSGFTGDLVIPDSVTSIGYRAFYRCFGFNGSLTIGSNVTSIGLEAFDGCSGFTGTLTIGSSVETIGSSAFEGCSGFSGSLVIPDGVISIEKNTFRNCSGFNGTLTIGSSVTSIGSRAFEGCSGFTGDLVIPENVISIGGSAFDGCSGLTGDLVIPNSVTSIGTYAFTNCSFTGNLIIPDSVTSIEMYTFSSCKFNGTLTIGSKVETIGECAFRGCSGFTGDLVIPNSVISIGEEAFRNCSGFNGELKIPEGVTSIGSYAFQSCSLKSITVPWAKDSRPAGWDEGWDSYYSGQIIYSEV